MSNDSSHAGEELAARVRPLPYSGTSFVGRVRDLRAIDALLAQDDTRLLTLLGPGGVGKTRLAIEVAKQWKIPIDEGVWFVSLESATSDTPLIAHIARAMSIELSPTEDPLSLLTRAIENQRILLVLDNLEHLPGAPLEIARILSHCATIVVLATSRTPLDIRGERQYPVAPLDTHFSDVPTLAELAQSDSIQLFVERARMVSPNFALTNNNASSIQNICASLDGLPLAIELAAAHTAILTPSALIEHIEAFRPLPLSGPQDVPGRHQTIQNVISWSHTLLSDNGESLFRWLSVFTGSFDLAAAQALLTEMTECGPANKSEDLVRGLGELIRSSLVRLEEWSGEARYSMLQTTRHFAFDLLMKSDEASIVQAAHASVYLALAERLQWAWLLAKGNELELLEIEQPNLLSALAWYENTHDAERLARLSLALTGYWYAHSDYQLGAVWIDRARAHASALALPLRGKLSIYQGLLEVSAGNAPHTEQYLVEGELMLNEEHDSAHIAVSLIWRNANAQRASNYELAENLLNKALTLADRSQPTDLQDALRARVLSNLGVVAFLQNDLALATERYEMALHIYRTNGSIPGLVHTLGDLGVLAGSQGDFTAAIAHFQECLSMPAAKADHRLLFSVLHWSARIAAEWQRPHQAVRILAVAEVIPFDLTEPDLTVAQSLHTTTLSILERTIGNDKLTQVIRASQGTSIRQAIDDIQSLNPRTSVDSGSMIRNVGLTKRQADILRLLAAGHQNREIADQLFLSVRTVEGHLNQIYNKLGVHTRAAAVAVALTEGLVPADKRPTQDPRGKH